MKKSSLLILSITLVLGIQSCKSDLNGPGDPVILAAFYDSSLVDISGTWRMDGDSNKYVVLTIETSGLRFYPKDSEKLEGNFDKRFSRRVMVKKNGRENAGTIYGVDLHASQVGLAIYSADSLQITEPCRGDPTPTLYGRYFRVR